MEYPLALYLAQSIISKNKMIAGMLAKQWGSHLTLFDEWIYGGEWGGLKYRMFRHHVEHDLFVQIKFFESEVV